MGKMWTPEQERAIYESGTNIIVSAGAGSGKTAVLTERVIEKLRSGTSVRELLILTFTNAAASEMKERIRASLMKEEQLKEELDHLDSAYITTFDSYALSLVKKYHYLLDLPKDINIVSNSIVSIKRKQFLDEILTSYYEQKDSSFTHLIHSFCIKNDQNIRSAILNFDDKLNLRTDKQKYLKNYINTYYKDEALDEIVKEYLNLIRLQISSLNDWCKRLELCADGEYFYQIKDALAPLLNEDTYQQWLNIKGVKLKNVPKNSSEEVKKIKKEITGILKEINELLCYTSLEEMKEELLKTKPFITVFIDILLKLDEKLNDWKKEHQAFEFHDISRLSLEILEEHEDIRTSIKNEFKEILVDEYQDTNDIQETFISYISNHNVYMVGDIKQSIYQFRNANPYIFKKKYDDYREKKDGLKIDLIKNFRSRKEVLEDINTLFIPIMGDDVGGADYEREHQMSFGNKSFIEKGKTNENYHMDILNYTYEKGSMFNRREIEIFAICKDIKEKIDKKYPIFDMKNGIIRPIEYRDFTILLQTGSDYDLYKKIFLHFNIPLQVYQDETIKTSYDVYIIKNIFILLSSIAKGKKDAAFKRAFMSVGRSFLMEMDDQSLYDVLKTNSYEQTELYSLCKNLVNELSFSSLQTIFERIIDTFNVYDKLIKVGNIQSALARLDYLGEVSKEVSSLGFTLDEFILILDEVLNGDEDIKMKGVLDQTNTVKLMNIHKSKGLEFPICYFASLDRSFNTDDIKGDFLYDKTLGMIIPFYDHGLKDTIVKAIYKNRYLKEMISERIRLFYVAVTRAKEKMIFVTDLSIKEGVHEEKVPVLEKLKYRSLNDMLCSIKEQLEPFIIPLEECTLNLSKDYMLELRTSLDQKLKKTNEKISEHLLSVQDSLESEVHYSKDTHDLWEEDLTPILTLGNDVHLILETLDLQDPDTSFIQNEMLKKKVECFLKQPIFDKIKEGKVYQEYAFFENDLNSKGIIDLFIVYEDHIDVIDYKLKQIDDPAYLKQVRGYQDYLEKTFNKPTYGYLYSLLDEKLKVVK